MCHHGLSHFGQYGSSAIASSAASEPRYAADAAIPRSTASLREMVGSGTAVSLARSITPPA